MSLFGGFVGFLREMDHGLAVMRGEEVGIGYRSTDVRETRAAEHVRFSRRIWRVARCRRHRRRRMGSLS